MMNDFVKVQGQPALVRDLNSGAIIDTDAEGFRAYIESRDRKLSLEKRVENIEDKLDRLLRLLEGTK